MSTKHGEMESAFTSVADWCERYFADKPQINIGHSFVTLVRIFGEMAALGPDDSVKRSLLDELAEAYLQGLTRGDLAGMSNAAAPPPSTAVQVEYMVHQALRGNTEWTRQPAECGVTGEGRRLEGFSLRLRGDVERVGLRYRAHLAGSGDTRWCRTNEYCGTVGKNRRLEAFWIEVTDGNDRYDVFYSAYLARYGWTGWFRNGQMCGTRGEFRQMESIRVFLAEKATPDSDDIENSH